MSLIAVWVGKLALVFLRLAGKRATSLPGKIALKVSPRLLSKLGRRLDRCIVVTGTNGKTTTSRLLAGILSAEEPIIHNTEGANLPQGLTSALLAQTNWLGRPRRKTALFEIDEATLPLVTKSLPVKVLVVTNVFRDQLDRYGELDTTLDKLLLGIEQTDAVLVQNGDDPLARILAVRAARPVRYFGLSDHHLNHEAHNQIRDGAFCLQCGHELKYTGFFYGQLGAYVCPECGFERPSLDFTGEVRAGSLEVAEGDLPVMNLPLPVRGLYNVYNVLAAVSAARICGFDAALIRKGLQSYDAPLGRMQGFDTNPPTVLNLIKNPTGCDSVIQAIVQEPGSKVLCIAINDLAADGRDVSWLWDADFEQFAEREDILHIVTTGLRAEDMALRMKYAGYSTLHLTVKPGLEDGLTESLRVAGELGGDTSLYVLSTYTALYNVAESLTRKVDLYDNAPAYRTSVS